MADPLLEDGPLPREPVALLRRFILPGLFVILLFAVLWWRRDSPTVPGGDIVLRGEALGTTWLVRVVPPDDMPEDLAARLEHETVAALDLVDQQMSTWIDTSVLSTLNRHPVGTPLPIPPELRAVLELSGEIGEATDGAFDITVGPLVAAWGFGAGKKSSPPTDAELAALRERIGFREIELTEAGATRTGDVQIDLSAIAKGYAVDLIASRIAALGAQRFMVEVGGEVVVRGRKADGTPWRLGIERPPQRDGEAHARQVGIVVALTDQALATSGDYRQYLTVDGTVVSHTIDPRTGRPVTHGPSSVSVVADDCATADAWATALMVLGPAGLPRAEAAGLAVLILERQADGTVVEHANAAFSALRID